MVNSRPQRRRDNRQAYYTTSKDIVSYMVAQLSCRPHDEVWEPCGGGGELVDGVLGCCPNAVVRVSEIDPFAADALKEKYIHDKNVSVYCEDTLDVGMAPLVQGKSRFTRIIANPPYGAWQSYERRAILKKRFPNLYVRDTYAVFLMHCFNLLEAEGRLVFIIPDTFLWLNRHENLRRRLLQQATIEEVALFPSKFFPGVNFGYSGLAIISLSKTPPRSDSYIKVVSEFSHVHALANLAEGKCSADDCKVLPMKQSDVFSRAHMVIQRPEAVDVPVPSTRANQVLGDIAEVKTGFYSGNNRYWLRRKSSLVPRSQNYKDIQINQIAVLKEGTTPPLDGFKDFRCFVPILRGGAEPFSKATQWYVDWSSAAVAEYRRAGENPARFQNSRFYFRQGLAVPMVASSRLTASLLDHRLFDQSIVGIFPFDSSLSLYLLGFLNTKIATTFLRRINSTANNSASYLKRLPVVLPNQNELVKANGLASKAISDIDQYGVISDDTSTDIETFYRQIWCEPSAYEEDA